jgi:matrix metalloproteinase-14 (membrane-inserted)
MNWLTQNKFLPAGDYYWKLTDTGIATGYPRKISADWPSLPSNLDAAFSWSNGKIYFFKVNVNDAARFLISTRA